MRGVNVSFVRTTDCSSLALVLMKDCSNILRHFLVFFDLLATTGLFRGPKPLSKADILTWFEGTVLLAETTFGIHVPTNLLLD